MSSISGVCEGNAIYDMTKQSLQGLEAICSGTGKCAMMNNNLAVQFYTEKFITQVKISKIKITLYNTRNLQIKINYFDSINNVNLTGNYIIINYQR